MIITKQNSKLSEIKENFTFIFDRNPVITGDYLCLVRHDDYLYLDKVYCDAGLDGPLWALTSWGREVVAWCAPFEFLAEVRKEIPN